MGYDKTMKLTRQQLSIVRLMAAAQMRGDFGDAERLMRLLPRAVILEVREVLQEMYDECKPS